MKMWAGRFTKELAGEVNDFNSSLSFDSRMYKHDIKGSIAHATMLCKCGINSESDTEKIISGLKGILSDIEEGRLGFDCDAEDIHMFVEAELTKRIGDAGKRLHTGRSRNDQVATDIRLYLRDGCDVIRAALLNLLDVILTLSKEHINTVLPAYTHLQRAQPVTFAHQLLAYGEMFKRDISRIDDCKSRMNYCPLGSGAVATTTYPIDRYMTAELLGFDGICENSMDGVSDRDFVCEILFCMSLIMMHLSRFSEEIILFCSSEYGFIELDDAYSTGSSIMPQKKNPDIAELVRGKCARVYGDLNTLLVMLKGLPLAYNKDMQEDKEAVFDALDNTLISINIFASMLGTVKVRADRMLDAARGGFINATDLADYLVSKGLPFRDAYKISGSLVGFCIERDIALDEVTLDQFKVFSPCFEADVYKAIDLWTCVNGRNAPGGPGEDSVKRQINLLEVYLGK